MLFFNNVMFYYTIKNKLVDHVEQQSLQAAYHLRDSIDRYKTSVRYIESMVGQQLRIAAIAAKDRLPPRAENVSNAQLEQLSSELGVSHIALLQRRGDDFVPVRSSDPMELMAGAEKWGYWYTALQQLLENRNVTIPEGQKLPNYWSDSIELADPSLMTKWGYFYDGTTDYIVSPYVEDVQIEQYDRLVGPDAILHRMIVDNPGMLEMTGFNVNTFGKPLALSKSPKGRPYVPLNQRPIPFGTYVYSERTSDAAFVREAYDSNKPITRLAELNGHKVVKSFVPAPNSSPAAEDDYPYVIGVVFDSNVIHEALSVQARWIVSRLVTTTAISLVLLFIVFQAIRRSKDEAVRVTQEAYIDEVNDMFTTIRGQRHDFLNHVQTIHTFLQLKKYDDLHRYTGELVGGIRQTNDIIQIGHPALAAIVQSKVVTAMDKHIDFRHQFAPIGSLNLGVTSVDIVIIIGNLIDNAFDEVAGLPVRERWVELSGSYREGSMIIAVRNPGRTLTDAEKSKIFEPGYSTKGTDAHSGIGLAVTKKRVHAYRGSITVESNEENGTTFTVSIPLNRFG
ncbi:hypothetical protein GCM10020370_24390 [Paenibacillus hodogayensis]